MYCIKAQAQGTYCIANSAAEGAGGYIKQLSCNSMQTCCQLGSYNAMFAIYSGISNGAVSRMKRTMNVCDAEANQLVTTEGVRPTAVHKAKLNCARMLTMLAKPVSRSG
jgi:hypothetical protein